MYKRLLIIHDAYKRKYRKVTIKRLLPNVSKKNRIQLLHTHNPLCTHIYKKAPEYGFRLGSYLEPSCGSISGVPIPPLCERICASAIGSLLGLTPGLSARLPSIPQSSLYSGGFNSSLPRLWMRMRWLESPLTRPSRSSSVPGEAFDPSRLLFLLLLLTGRLLPDAEASESPRLRWNTFWKENWRFAMCCGGFGGESASSLWIGGSSANWMWASWGL